MAATWSPVDWTTEGGPEQLFARPGGARFAHIDPHLLCPDGTVRHRPHVSLLLFVVTLGCGADPASDSEGTPVSEGVEQACLADPSNDTQQAPTALGAATQTLDGLSVCDNDTDWYRLPLPAHHALAVEVSSDAALTAALFEASATTPIDDGTQLVVDATSIARTFDVQVSGLDGAVGPYRMDVEMVCSEDGAEPNDDRDAATTLAPDGSLTGRTLCAGDEDWFTLDADTADGQGLRIRVLTDAPELAVEILEPGEDAVLQRAETSGDGRFVMLPDAAAGTSLRVFTEDGSLASYDLDVAEVPNDELCADNVDCGDTFCDAGACAACTLDEQCGAFQTCEVGVCVDTPPCAGNLCGGGEVCDERTRACVPYLCTPDAVTDDTLQTAGSVGVGDIVFGAICTNDEDWFLITQPEGERLVVDLSYQRRVGDLDLTVFDVVVDPFSTGTSRTRPDLHRVIVEPLPRSRAMAIRVRGGMGSAADYQIEVSTGHVCDDGTLLPVDDVDVCDGVAQCPDASDEDCFLCDDGEIVTPASWACDVVEDCGDASDEQGCATCDIAEEETSLLLACPSGQVISSVAFASYGTPTGACGSLAQGACHAEDSMSVVASRCVGLNQCSVQANNEVFGEPCLGVLKSLAAEVTCQAPDVCDAPPSCIECSDGQVVTNAEWRCDGVSDCDDGTDEVDCGTPACDADGLCGGDATCAANDAFGFCVDSCTSDADCTPGLGLACIDVDGDGVGAECAHPCTAGCPEGMECFSDIVCAWPSDAP